MTRLPRPRRRLAIVAAFGLMLATPIAIDLPALADSDPNVQHEESNNEGDVNANVKMAFPGTANCELGYDLEDEGPGICFYTEPNYEGNRAGFGFFGNNDGVADIAASLGTSYDNNFSSASNPSGRNFCAYTEPNFGGDVYMFWAGPSWSYFGYPLDNSISSIRPC